MSAWQNVDDSHRPGQGAIAYRVVYKTLRTVVAEAVVRFPNLLMRFGHGSVNRGGVRLPGAVPGRRRGEWYLTETGRLVERDDGTCAYDPDVNMQFQFAGWEDDIKDAFFVELIMLCSQRDPFERLREGRRNLASLTTMLELRFGPRLLGIVLAEEIGELHSDDHWSRSLATDRLAAESSYDVELIDEQSVLDFNNATLRPHVDSSEADKKRRRLACDWYWSAIHAEDPVTEYLRLWFVVEALAMPNTTNVRPVKDLLAAGLGGNRDDWELVGRHLGRRSTLVHGNIDRGVDDSSITELRLLVEVLLMLEFGIENQQQFGELKAIAGVA
jgi:hypothetical protein